MPSPTPSDHLFRVDQIDHVELFVPDRYQAAAWYQRVLGLEVVPEYEKWAEHPRGPLMISSDGGSTKLALFQGSPQGSRETAGYHLVAFRVGAANFARFLERLPALDLTDHRGQRVTAAAVVDHEAAFSLYFCDPYGHRLELTTYDVSRRLGVANDVAEIPNDTAGGNNGDLELFGLPKSP